MGPYKQGFSLKSISGSTCVCDRQLTHLRADAVMSEFRGLGAFQPLEDKLGNAATADFIKHLKVNLPLIISYKCC